MESAHAGDDPRRVAPVIDPIAGDWIWFNEVTVSILADGTMHGTNRERGRWKLEDRTYVLTWDAGWIDRLSLSADHARLTGRNNLGTAVSGVRKGKQPPPVPKKNRDCGTGLDDPGCTIEKNGKLPPESDVFTPVLTAAKAQRSQISRREQIVAALGKQSLTARQFGLVLDLFDSEIDRLRTAKALAKNVVDPARALGFATKWRSEHNRRDYTKLISDQIL